MTRHFIDISDILTTDLNSIIELALKLKKDKINSLLKGYQLAMIFEKPSTRTRVSFEAGINQLGGNAISIDNNNSQLGRGETIEDTAQVLSRFVDLIAYRCFLHSNLIKLSKYSKVPVINALSNYSHPCQIMADVMTFIEHKGSIKGKVIAWIGDGNNVLTSWIHAAEKFDFQLNIATPTEYKPKINLTGLKNISYSTDPVKAVKDSDLVVTDTWVSMGDSDEEVRKKILTPYQVNSHLMSYAKKDAIFMHCLPCHREDEVTGEIIDGKQSVVFDEAENRLHIQKAIMIWCLQKDKKIG